MQKIIVKIDREDISLATNKEIECFIVSSDLTSGFINDFKEKAQHAIVLIDGENAADLCVKYNLDGIVADLSKSTSIKSDMKSLREKIGNKILGVISRSRRHEAMIVSENEPDFIVFKMWSDGIENIIELLSWYNEFFLLQSAIMPQDNECIMQQTKADIGIFDLEKYKILVAKSKSLD